MPVRPNILFLTHRVPHPPNRGDRIRSWNMLRYLSERANMHLACLADEPVSEVSNQELHRHCQRVTIQPGLGLRRWFNGLGALFRSRSITEGMFQSPKLQKAIRQWARETEFDAVLVFCSSMYQYTRCPELAGIPTVVDLVDVDSEKWQNYAESASFPKRQVFQLEAKRVRQLELEIANKANAVTLVSAEEVKVFRQFCKTENIHAISNGVDLDYFHPAPPEYQKRDDGQPYKLVFVGVLDYRANIEGLRWFCKEVWPDVRKQVPNIELDIVGRRPGDAARQLATIPGINLIGEVDDVRPYVWRADVVIAPLKIARGIQNKVLEAMAMGKPVIATPQAIEGTGANGGREIVSRATFDEWVDAIVECVTNEKRRLEISFAARDYVATFFKWAECLTQIDVMVGTKAANVGERAKVTSDIYDPKTRSSQQRTAFR